MSEDLVQANSDADDERPLNREEFIAKLCERLPAANPAALHMLADVLFEMLTSTAEAAMAATIEECAKVADRIAGCYQDIDDARELVAAQWVAGEIRALHSNQGDHTDEGLGDIIC